MAVAVAPQQTTLYVSVRHAEALVLASGTAQFQVVQRAQIYEKIRNRMRFCARVGANPTAAESALW
jgi:NADH pyrophosphatase NudC (nudix superfamily)